jgi:hypothetical protein
MLGTTPEPSGTPIDSFDALTFDAIHGAIALVSNSAIAP